MSEDPSQLNSELFIPIPTKGYTVECDSVCRGEGGGDPSDRRYATLYGPDGMRVVTFIYRNAYWIDKRVEEWILTGKVEYEYRDIIYLHPITGGEFPAKLEVCREWNVNRRGRRIERSNLLVHVIIFTETFGANFDYRVGRHKGIILEESCFVAPCVAARRVSQREIWVEESRSLFLGGRWVTYINAIMQWIPPLDTEIPAIDTGAGGYPGTMRISELDANEKDQQIVIDGQIYQIPQELGEARIFRF